MKNNLDIHSVQADILMVLLQSPDARFSDLNKAEITSDHFNFHLKSLLDKKLIEKNLNGKYQLTTEGKEFADRFDTDTSKYEKQAKIGVMVVGVRVNNGVKEILMQKRLKQPYFGYLGFVTGKIKWGESVSNAGARELLEEANVKAKLTLVGIEHKRDFSKDQNLLDDKYFYVFKAEEIEGELLEKFKEGENIWMTKEKLLEYDKVFHDVKDIINLVEEGQFKFMEQEFVVEEF